MTGWCLRHALALMLVFATHTPVEAQEDLLGLDDDSDLVEEDSGAEMEDGADADTQGDGTGVTGDDADSSNTDAGVPADGDPMGHSATAADAGRAVIFTLGIGGGVGSRAFKRPTRFGQATVPDAFFPTAEIVGHLHLWPDATWSMEAFVAYQTSVGFSIRERPLFAFEEEYEARSSRLELSLGPVLRLGESSDALRLALPIGFGLRAFTPAIHHQRASEHLLAGPQARIELIAPLGDSVTARLGPEALWLLLMDSSLEQHGVASMGFAFGGQALIETRVGSALSCALAFRQSIAMATSSRAVFRDVERSLTIRLQGRL